MSSAVPAWFRAATVSPPPATAISLPALASSAAYLAASTELHAPRRLPDLVAQLRDSGPPLRPIDAGV